MTDVPEKIEKIEKIGEEGGTAEEKIPQQRVEPNKQQFDNLMGNEKAAPVAVAEQPAPVSLMDTVRDLNYTPKPGSQVSSQTLMAQTQEAISRIDEIKQTLSNPNVAVKSSAQQLLQGKLNHIDESLKVALSRAGVEYNPTADATAAAANNAATTPNPVERFLGFLTDGQDKLANLNHELEVVSASGQDLSPVNMLAIQVKVTQIQQELELFSNLLGKALDSIKTIMNIQV